MNTEYHYLKITCCNLFIETGRVYNMEEFAGEMTIHSLAANAQ